MRAYVTGATGFVGGHVAAELRSGGAEVRDERVDLLDRGGLERIMADCDAVIHSRCALQLRRSGARLPADQCRRHANVIEACRSKGVRRLIHTSTAGTCGPVPGREATEADSPPTWELSIPYKRTKLAAERLVIQAARDGLDAVVVNPTTPIGDGDRKPTPTGRMIAGVARGRIRAYVATTGLNVVDVRDVARGHALALERGKSGERYLLGGANLPLEELFGAIADLAGRPRPRLRIPYALAERGRGGGPREPGRGPSGQVAHVFLIEEGTR